jgi:hypothetical protein
MSKVIDIIKDALRLADKVEALSNKTSEMAKEHREEIKDLRQEIHEIDKRLVRMESMLEFARLQRNIEEKNKNG